MLHRLWGKAQEHPDYNEEEWMTLQAQINHLQMALGYCPVLHNLTDIEEIKEKYRKWLLQYRDPALRALEEE